MVEEATQGTAFTLKILQGFFATDILCRIVLQLVKEVVGAADAGIYMLPTGEQLIGVGVPCLDVPVLIPTGSLGIDGRVATGEEVWLEAPVSIISIIRVNQVIDTVEGSLGIILALIGCSLIDYIVSRYIQEFLVVTGCQAQTHHAAQS